MAERSITFCTEELQEAWYAALNRFKVENPTLPTPILTCTYRSPEEQLALYNQPFDHVDNDHDGKIDEPDEKVTNAKPGQSYHNTYPSKAFDIAFKTIDGKLDWDTKLFKAFADIMKEVNPKVIWGGNWKTIKDTPHFELH